MQKKMMTVFELAELLNVPVSWVYARTRKRDHGGLPAVKIGKYYRFIEADVMNWLKRCDGTTRDVIESSRMP